MRLVNSNTKRIINSNNKYIIECKDGKYRIANISGIVPKDSDCIISDWHIKDGKIIKKGKVCIVPGNGNFHIANNIIEFARSLGCVSIDVSGNVIISSNIFYRPNCHSDKQVVLISCKKQCTIIGNVCRET